MKLLGVIFVIISIIMLVKPELVWAISESWKMDGAGEVSSLYKLSTRVGGAIIMIIGIALLIML